MKRFLTLFLCVAFTLGLFPMTSMALPEWPSDLSIQAEGGVVLDADSGAVLYEKNMHVSYFPASITKLLTALIVIENCNMDETVTFSENAVYNVEYNSKSMGMVPGDTMSVKDCLYGLLLQSANEVANALAEHVAGSTELFADMMNERAESLGCTDTHFSNPSGLNDPNHYTSAYDMALIAKAALHNETLVSIDSTLSYHIPPSKDFKEGQMIYPGHKMMKKKLPEYYSGIIGGKTGYTSLAGNTLVTYVERDGMRLIAVVLNGHKSHYIDTKAMLDFGFKNFHDIKAGDYDTTYTEMESDMAIAGLSTITKGAITMDAGSTITLPLAADFNDLTSNLDYDITELDPSGSIAKIHYLYGDRPAGIAYLTIDTSAEETAAAETAGAAPETKPLEPTAKENPISTFFVKIPNMFWIILTAALLLISIISLGFAIKNHWKKNQELERLYRHDRRIQRLKDIGCSAEEFDLYMEQRRTTKTTPHRKRGRKRRFH